jgi:hypothetical protein
VYAYPNDKTHWNTFTNITRKQLHPLIILIGPRIILLTEAR